MKSYILLSLVVFGTIFGRAQSNTPKAILGKWYNVDRTNIIEITKQNNGFVGHIVWMKKPNYKNGNPKLDIKNPNKNLRKQKILGSQTIFGLMYKNGQWTKGKIYSHKRGGSVKFKVISVSKTELKIEISIGFFPKAITFTKAN